MPELTIRDAARRLGVSVDTIRRRVRRGELTARRDHRGRLLVDVPEAAIGSSPQQPDASLGGEPMGMRMQRLEEEITWLRGQLDKAAEERAELRRLLGMSMQAVPAPARSETPPAMPRSGQETDENRPRLWRWLERLLGD